MTATAQPTITPENAAAVIRRYGGVVAKPVDNPDRGLVMGIYGPGGSGKTTLAATITDTPEGAPALFLNSRGNPHVVSSYGDRIDVLQIERYDQVELIRQDILKDAAKGTFPYKSIVLDTTSEMFYTRLRDLYGPVTAVDWTKHSATTANLMQLHRNWIDLAETAPFANVIFIFQEVPEKRTIRNQTVESRSEISFNKALQGQIPTLVNFLGRLYIVGDNPPYKRLLDFRPVETVHQSKFQVDRKHPTASQVPMEIYNPSLAPILDTIRGSKPFPVTNHTKDAK